MRRWPTQKLVSGPGGYTDVVVLEHAGKDWAAVVFEFSTCTIKVGIVDPHTLLPAASDTN